MDTKEYRELRKINRRAAEKHATHGFAVGAILYPIIVIWVLWYFDAGWIVEKVGFMGFGIGWVVFAGLFGVLAYKDALRD